MSTQIKKNGNWVTVAGGTRMWVGTKAALQAALDAGELVDGTAVMVTDDYEGTLHPHPDWANAVAITAAEIYAGYTAPSDGLFICNGVMPETYNNTRKVISVNNIEIVKGAYTDSGVYSFGSAQCPVNSGDLIKANMASSSQYETRYFVPWK